MKTIYKTSLFGMLLFVLACSKEKEVAAIPEEPKPLVNFTYTQASTDDAFTIKFESTIENGKKIRWEFGDDSVSTDAKPTHTFLAPGTYRVFLTAENDQGYKAQKEALIKLNADDVLNIAATPQMGGVIKLNASSATVYTEFDWRFEDGSFSTEASPVTFVPPGTVKAVVLTAKTSKGAVVSINRLITDFGVGQDVTRGAVLSVSRDNDAGSTSGEGSLKLTDNDNNSKWLLFNWRGPEWAQQLLLAPEVVKFYSLTSGGDASGRDPKSWKLEGSTDGETWELLDTRENQTFPGRNLTRLFIINNNKAFGYYRWTVNTNNGDGLFQISEWRLNKIN